MFIFFFLLAEFFFPGFWVFTIGFYHSFFWCRLYSFTSSIYLTLARPFVLSVHNYTCRITSVISSNLSRFISVMKLRTSNHNYNIVTFKVGLYLSYFVSQGLAETCSDITVAAANGGFPATCALSWFFSGRVSCSCFSLLPFWRGFSWRGSHNWAQWHGIKKKNA